MQVAELSMEAAEPWKHANNRNEGCKEQNHGCMQAAEMKHANSRTEVCKQQNYVEASKQQNYGSMQAAEPCGL